MTLGDYLGDKKKSQLQAFHLHWLPGEEVTSARGALLANLARAMGDPGIVRERFDRLKRPQRDFLLALLGSEGYASTSRTIRHSGVGQRIEDFELKSAVETLRDQGFIQTSTSHRWIDAGTEEYVIPREIGDALRVTIDIEEREPKEILGLGPRVAPQWDDPAAAVSSAIEALADADLRALAVRAIEDHDGILMRSHAHLDGDRPRLHRSEWRGALEEAGIGTTGVLSLKDYGIEVEEEALVIYPRNVHAVQRRQAAESPEEIDGELSLGVDLIIDLARLLDFLRTEPLELTREGSLYKKSEERLAPKFVLYPHADRFEGRVVEKLVSLAGRLHLIDRDASRLRPDTVRVRLWEKKDIIDRTRAILDHFLADGMGARGSFHQRPLREIFIDEISAIGDRWARMRPLLSASVARFLAEIESRGIAREFQSRFRGEVGHESLIVPFARLHHDLSYWIVNRLALLGIVDLGYRGVHVTAVRISPLGAAALRLPWPEGTEEKALLVNPDFEVMLFPGGPRSWDVTHTVSRFADRIGWEQVKRYRLHRESIKRGVLSGLTPDAIVTFLSQEGRAPIPKNVAYSIREWSEGVEFIRRQRAILLRGQSPEGVARLAEALRRRGIAFEAATDLILIVRGTRNEKALTIAREELREEGLFLD
ncbi:MAG: helicase-associated domain-containing protein [Planctomycetes bacterium]|nr:helicase-associated domain-containing protein [Planctomycetota bacterium]